MKVHFTNILLLTVAKLIMYITSKNTKAANFIKVLDQQVISFSILGGTLKVCIISEKGKLIPASPDRPANLGIIFKSYNHALALLLGIVSVPAAFAQNRITVIGNLRLAIAMGELLEESERILFPHCFYKHLFREKAAHFSINDLSSRIQCYILAPIFMFMALGRYCDE